MARNRVWEFIKKVGRDIDDQVWTRSGPHGAAELGAALAGQSNAYVMYGHAGRPGTDRPAPGQEKQQQQQSEPARPEPEQQPDRGRTGRRR